MKQYPNICPPQRDGYGLTPVSPLIRTEMQTGRARQEASLHRYSNYGKRQVEAQRQRGNAV